jgi:PAS domain S-box-containing protein
MIDGEIKYALTMSLSPAFIQRLLEHQTGQAHWLSTIIDANKIIVARTKDVEALRGKPASASLSANSAGTTEGWWTGRPSGSEDSYVAHRRSNVSGWTVAIAVPVSSVNRPLWQALGLIMGGIVFFLAVAVGIAAIFWRRIFSSINALAKAAITLRQGKTPDIEPSPITELDQVKKTFESMAAEWKAAADGLEYQRRLFENVTSNIAEPVLVTDAHGRITFANSKATAMFGFSATELLGQSLAGMLDHRCADTASLTEKACGDTCASAGTIAAHQHLLLHKDGTPLILDCAHVPLEVDRRHVGAILIVRDIRAANGRHTDADEPPERRPKND